MHYSLEMVPLNSTNASPKRVRRVATILIAEARFQNGFSHLHDNLEVRNHHSYSAEERLQVFGKLLPTGVARVHGDEKAAYRLKKDVLWVSWKLEELHSRLLRVLNRQHLSNHDKHASVLISCELSCVDNLHGEVVSKH